jgi:lipopolysaccharide/colanic/teichoic acid biosynthesis glycosyltransferase
VKRGFDIVFAGSALVVLSPLLVALLVVVGIDMLLVPSDRGPLFYREPRVSRGREFDILKFRTVRVGALRNAAAHVRLLEADRANLTWAGCRVLKPWYLDELPQLLNVLAGDMSIVGPRPWPPALVADQVASGHDYRLRVRAGLTGPAQVAKGTDATFLALDLAYVHALATSSPVEILRLDVRILRRTLDVLARGEGLSF